MFIGREEMALLEKLYAINEFEFLVLYGRRRTGKTELLNQFYSRHKEQSVFFTCIEQNMPLNLEEFSKYIFSAQTKPSSFNKISRQ